MNSRKIKLTLLSIILAASVLLGIFFLSREKAHSENLGETTQPSVGPSSELDWLSDTRVQYRASETEVEKEDTRPFPAYDRFWLYEGQLCRLTYVAADSSYQLTSMETGQLLKTYDSACFAGHFETLSLDAGGNLWALYLGDSGQYQLRLCEPGSSPEDDPLVGMQDVAEVQSIGDFAVWEDFAAIQYYDSSYEPQLTVIDRACNTLQHLDQIKDFCFDGKGNLYTLIWTGNGDHILEKRSLSENKVLWTNRELPFLSCSLWYLEGSGLFLLSEQSVAIVDQETGNLSHDLLDFRTDVSLGEDLEKYAVALRLGVGSDGVICISAMDYSLNSSSRFCDRYTWRAEPFIPEVDPADVVTLTITAPYPVDSLIGSVRKYQREHPEVQVVWDTQYISREEFQANVLEYKDQIAVRTVTGDVGDLQMIVGAGISQDVITDTDAFADLAPYLEACSFKNELEWNLIETLRGEDGAIRAIPMGNVPNFFLYNMSLIEGQNLSIDPDSVTWSELLDLALQWKEDGTDLSLTSSATSGKEIEKSIILTQLLLANLYGTEQADGSVQLDQPYLRELLTKLKELWNAPQLVRTDGDYFTEGFFKKSLYTVFDSSTSFGERIGKAIVMPEREGISVYAGPAPWGEEYKKQQGYAFCWGIPASSGQKNAAWELLEFIISSEGLPDYGYSQDTDNLNNAAQEKRFSEWTKTNMEGGEDFFNQLQALRKLPISRFDEPYGWRDAVLVPIQNYLDGNCTLDEALALASDNWERFLKG